MSNHITTNLQSFATQCGAIEDTRIPMHCYPDPMRTFCLEVAGAIGIDVAFPAAAILSILGTAIGNSRIVRLKRGWTEPSIFWTGLVGPPSAKKSPVISKVSEPLQKTQGKWFESFRTALAEYRTEEKRHHVYEKAWEREQLKRGSTLQLPPIPPEKPACQRCIVRDTTIEAIVPILFESPRSLIAILDELVAWFGSMNAYRKNGGKDEGFWLSAFQALPITVDRKGHEAIHVPLGFISLLGGIQPGVLRQLLADKPDILRSGMLARLILVGADPPRNGWSDQEVDASTLASMDELIRNLLNLNMREGETHPEPEVVGVADGARQLFIDFCNWQHTEQLGKPEWVQGIYSKHVAYIARLALVFHLVKTATGETSTTAIEPETMRDAITIGTWFRDETIRVVSGCIGDSGNILRDKILAFIRANDGVTSPRDLQRKFHVSSDEADAHLKVLVEDGLGSYETPTVEKAGGRPKTVFRLSGDVAL